MAKELGPTFGQETIDAGLGGLPIAWGKTDDTIIGRENLTTAQNESLDTVVELHDPSKKLPPAVTPEESALYHHENRIRALEGVPPISLEEVVEKIKTKKLEKPK